MHGRWRAIQVYGGVGLGVVLLGWFLWSTDLPELARVLAGARWRWLAVAVVAVLGHYLLHGIRWKVLLHHVVPDLDLHTVWRATTILWAFNTLLPLRAGNLLRPAVVALARDVAYTTLLFTMVAETVCDVFAMVALALVTLRITPPTLGGETAQQLRELGTGAGVVALVALVVVVLLSTRGARTAMEALLTPIPSARVRDRILMLFDQLVEGMSAVGEPRRLVAALVLTVGVWGMWLVSILATLWAFGLDVPVAAAMLIESVLTLATTIPQAPGFLGTFQVVTEKTLVVFGAPTGESKAVALVLWFVCFVPITLLGVWDASRMGIAISPSARRDTFTQLSDHTDERVDPAARPPDPGAGYE